MSYRSARTERLHDKIVALMRRHGNMTLHQVRMLIGHSKNEIEYVLTSDVLVDGVGFRRVGTMRHRGHDVYVYGLTERTQAPRSQQEILDRMARLAKQVGRLYRDGRRTEAMEVFETWQRLSSEFSQNAQNGQI